MKHLLLAENGIMAETAKHSTQPEGFVIHCKDDISVTVSTSQATKLKDNCEYFRSMFEHGTVESTSQTIFKQDWSSTTSIRFIELITSETSLPVTTESLEEFHKLATAADQVLFEIRMISPFNSELVPQAKTKISTELSNLNNFVFFFEMEEAPTVEDWDKLLDDGILLSMDWDVLLLVPTSFEDKRWISGNRYSWYKHEMGKQFKVYSIDAFHALRRLCPPKPDDDSLAESGDNSVSNDDYSKDPFHALRRIYLPEPDDDSVAESDDYSVSNDDHWTLLMPASKDLLQTISVGLAKKLSGLQFDQGKYRKFGGKVHLVFSVPTLEMLGRIFTTIRRYLTDNRVVLKLTYTGRNAAQLKMFVNACLDCEDDKGTFCYTAGNDVIALKTISDMTILLNCLIQNQSSSEGVIYGKFSVRHFKAWGTLEKSVSACSSTIVDPSTPRHIF